MKKPNLISKLLVTSLAFLSVRIFAGLFVVLFAAPSAFADAVLTDSGGEKLNSKTAAGTVVQVQEGAIIASGTQIQLLKGQYATLSFDTGMDVIVTEESDVKVNEDSGVGVLDLIYGEIRSFLTDKTEAATGSPRIYIRTPAAVVGVRGTDFVVSNDRTVVNVHTLEGAVAVSPSIKDFTSGSTTDFAAGEALEKHTLGAPIRKGKFDKNKFVTELEKRRGKLKERFQRSRERRATHKQKLQAMRETRQVRRGERKGKIEDRKGKIEDRKGNIQDRKGQREDRRDGRQNRRKGP